MSPAAIIFDFDGVIADSEVAANRALAESLTAIGLPTSYEDSLALYCGHNWRETERRIEERLGRPLPPLFRERQREIVGASPGSGLEPVQGAAAFLERISHLPTAIASSSREDHIVAVLERFGFARHFHGHIYSAEGMARGKPHPDIYLRAAAGLGLDPSRSAAIEDSPVGARAAVAAGMHVIGLCVASHIADPASHAESLRAVGVHQIAFDFADIALGR